MTISLPRQAPIDTPALYRSLDLEPAPVFVDDSGRRKVGMRVVWLAAILAALTFYASTTIANVVVDPKPGQWELASTEGLAPYAFEPHGLALASQLVADLACASITGHAFVDWDLNGARTVDGTHSEVGAPGVEVTAFDAAGRVVASAVTAEDGSYRLALEPPAAVRVEFTSPTKAYIESPVGPTSGSSTQFPVAPACRADIGVTWRGATWGPVSGVDRTGVGQVTGWVWFDDDCDGVVDPGESGGSGALVELRDLATGELLAGTTTNDGRYAFGGLVAGERYAVSFPGVADEGRAPFVVTSHMDELEVEYSVDGGSLSARFTLAEQGQSVHGVNAGIIPAGGCQSGIAGP